MEHIPDEPEQWREFFDGNYEVSTLGNVRRATPASGTYVGRPVKQRINFVCGGYCRVGLTRNGKPVEQRVHVLVAAAFICQRPHGLEINHIDGNKLNNKLSNLEYVTRAENMRHASEIMLTERGSTHHNSKLTEDKVRRMRALSAAGASYSSLGRMFGVSHAAARRAVIGKTWRHVA